MDTVPVDAAARDATPAPRATRWSAAVAGVVAAGVGLAASELAAGLTAAVPSLVAAVGGVVVDGAPAAVVKGAIAILGTADKPALIVGIVAVAGACGALLGVVSARRLWVGAAGFAAAGMLGALAGAREPSASAPAAGIVAAVAVAAGVGVLRLLLARAPRVGSAPRGSADAAVPAPPARMRPRGDRRQFLQLASGAAAAAAVAAVGGRARSRSGAAAAARDALALPPPSVPLPAPPPGAGLGLDGLAPLFTPNDDFYRIDTALRIPRVDPAGWRLEVVGMVERPLSLSLEDLLGMPLVEADVTLSCVSNEVGGDLVGNARWMGVALPAVLERAGVQIGATQIVGRSVDGWTAGFPTEVAFDGRDALVALGMNGEPLPLRHGFPARLVVPGLYGYVSATKWLAQIELTTWEAFDAYWVPRGWSKEGPIKTASRIDVPAEGAQVPAGRVAVAGVAWAGIRGIRRVEVSVDDGPWRSARLADELAEASWRQWVWHWDVAERGRHTLRVRAADGQGRVQTAKRSDPAPDGATGHHSITVTVV